MNEVLKKLAEQTVSNAISGRKETSGQIFGFPSSAPRYDHDLILEQPLEALDPPFPTQSTTQPLEKRYPLEPLAVPQDKKTEPPDTVKSQVVNDCKNIALPEISYTAEKEEVRFELMEVQIAVYGISGILGRVDNSKRRKKKSSSLSTLGSSIATASKGSPGNTPTRSLSTYGSKFTASPSTTPSSLRSSRSRLRESFNPPTTAVVSFRRNVLSSGTGIETFLPSLPLTALSSPGKVGNTTRYTCSWQSFGDETDFDFCQSAPFKVHKVMKQEPYKRGASVKDFPIYSYENIDLRIFIGRGKEILPLGVATLVISGEEDGEVVMNLPVRLPPEKHRRRSKLTPPGSKRRRNSFSDDPEHVYELEENATLRVGVRVLPLNYVEQAQNVKLDPKEKQAETLEKILADKLDDNCMIELHDENSLIRKFVTGDLEQPEAKISPLQISEQNTENGNSAALSAFFCGALEIFSEEFRPKQNPAANNANVGAGDVRRETSEQRVQHAVALPLSLVSSVSESLATEMKPPNR